MDSPAKANIYLYIIIIIIIMVYDIINLIYQYDPKPKNEVTIQPFLLPNEQILCNYTAHFPSKRISDADLQYCLLEKRKV